MRCTLHPGVPALRLSLILPVRWRCARRDQSTLTSSLTSLSRKRPAPVSPGKRSGRSTSGSDRSPGHDASPKPRRPYSLQSRATDFLKSAPPTNSSGSSGAIPKRARRSELRVEVEFTRSTSVSSDGASSLPPAPSHLIPYSSDSDSCSDILMTVSNDSLSSEVSQQEVQTHCPKKGDVSLPSTPQIDTVPLSRGDARVESGAIGGTASVSSPGSARLSPELIPRDADHRGDALQVTPINASTDPTPDTPVEAPSEPEVSLRQRGAPDNPTSVRTDADTFQRPPCWESGFPALCSGSSTIDVGLAAQFCGGKFGPYL